MMPAEQLFDGYAASYQTRFNEHPLGRYQRAVIQQETRAFLERLSTVLDIGCGPGSDFEFYSRFDVHIDAIDISDKMTGLARRRADELHLNARIEQSSLNDFNPGRKYDFIMLNFGVINALDNLTDVLSRLSSMLNSKGILVIVSMPPFHLFTISELFIRLKFRHIFGRLIKKRLLVGDTEIYYYGAKPFRSRFQVLRRVHLCSVLPSPEQYSRHGVFRKLTNWLMAADKKIRCHLPAFAGGDHVCHILTHRGGDRRSVTGIQI